MGKSSGGGSSAASALQTAATINAINAANSASIAPPPAPMQAPRMPYMPSMQAQETARNSFAAGLQGQQADILGGSNKKKNRLAAAPDATAMAEADTAAAPAADTFTANRLG